MIFAALVRRITAVLLLLALTASPLISQINFDAGNSEVVFWNNSSVDQVALTFYATNLIFDDELELTHRFAHDDNQQSLNADQSCGYDGPWSKDGLSGDVDFWADTLGCGEYEFYIYGVGYFRLNLIDAKWGAGSNSSVYRILIEYDGSDVNLHVRSPGVNGTWMEAATVTNGSTYDYWELIQATHLSTYERERTTYNDEIFHVEGDDNLLPLPSTGVKAALLDVDLTVYTDIAVPDGASLVINGFDEGPAGYSNTTMLFDAGTGFTVYGELITMQTQYQNEFVYLQSLSDTPAAGDWNGVHCDQSSSLWLNRFNVLYAVTGLFIDGCADVEGYTIRVYHSSDDGIEIDGSNGIIHDVTSNWCGANALLITDSEIELYKGVFGSSSNQNGIVVGEGSTARLHRCSIYYNRQNGVLVSGASRAIIDSCDIFDNNTVAGESWNGVYGFFNDVWLTVRHSTVHGQNTGLCMLYAAVNGYESPSHPPRWDNPDSLARNCIYDNNYNLFGHYATFELGRAYYNGSEPHYQGGESSVYYPTTLQGWFQYSTAYLHRDFWNGNTIFNVDNSTVDTRDALVQDMANCHFEDRSSSPAPGGIYNAQALALCESWEALAADSLRTLLYGQRNTLSAQNAAMGLGLVWRIAEPAVVESYCKQMIANCSRPEVQLPAYRYLASARMAADDWSGAAQALLAMTQQTARGSQAYTSAHAMAALAMYWDGSAAAARASIDTLLQAFPTNRDIIMVHRLIGGSSASATPKRSDTAPDAQGYMLHEVHPNPFTESAMITFTLPEARNVTVSVYDINGREVQRLAEGWYAEGESRVVFHRGTLPSGTYLVRLTAGAVTRTRMMQILR